MDSRPKFFNLLLVVLLLACILISTGESRPLMNILESSSSSSGHDQGIGRFVKDELSAFMDSLALGAVKNSGPSPGVGH